MKRRAALFAILALLAVGLAACGSSSSSSSSTTSNTATANSSTTSTISNTKAKFALHAGLAFGALYQWVYKPAKAGELSHPLQHKFTAIKAGLAAAFAYHELGLALKDAQADATLSKLVAPITALQNQLHGAKSGSATPADAASLDSAISSIKSQAQSAGTSITNKIPASPSG